METKCPNCKRLTDELWKADEVGGLTDAQIKTISKFSLGICKDCIDGFSRKKPQTKTKPKVLALTFLL